MSDKVYQAYYELTQKVAEAIQLVTGIDVTIMNDQRKRIAGTGLYKSLINQIIAVDTVFDCCLHTGETYYIDEPRIAPVCFRCPWRENCNEKAEICVPIAYKKETIGVIGIIAFDEEQKKTIVLNKETYLNFTQKMASLLEGKYAEIQIDKEKQQLSHWINSILNTIHEALIVFRSKGEIVYRNHALDILLQEVGAIKAENFFSQIWEQVDRRILPFQELESDRELQQINIVNSKGDKIALLSSLTTMKKDANVTEYIVTLQSIKRIEKKVIQMAEGSQVKLVFDDILGLSENIREVKRMAKTAAHSKASILIYGESGTGKEMFARAVHNESSRASYPFIPINCGAIPDDLLESELFGHEKGAFTGAVNTKMGKFEVAENGTIFLDEISEMPYRLQVKLLRVLQEKEVCRIGSNSIRKLDVRIIASSNKDLLKMVKQGTFREDLYYRLNIIPIHIPPLRERKEDILFIAQHFMKYYAKQLNKKSLALDEETQRIFLSYVWPGNVRELQNLIEYAISLENGQGINHELIKKRINIQEERSACDCDCFLGNPTLKAFLENAERNFLEKMFKNSQEEKHGVLKLCSKLKISRATLYRKCKRLRIRLEEEPNTPVE